MCEWNCTDAKKSDGLPAEKKEEEEKTVLKALRCSEMWDSS